KYYPEAVAFARTTEEISLLLKLANKHLFPVIPRGSGSGFTGGSVPVKGGLVLCLTRMNNILTIDTDNLVAEVEPGVITGEFQKEVEKRGLFYPPDPASLKFSTLGGNVAECAGGPRCLKYGVTKDYVLGLEVVLANGDIIQTGAKTMKSVAGYDLTSFLVGSEGTLGVITKMYLKLLPLPETRKTMQAIFPSMDNAARTVSEIIKSKIIPSTLEFLDQAAIRCVEEYLKMGLPVDAEALLIIEVDGDREVVDKDAKKIEALCLQGGADTVMTAKTEEEAEGLWKVRRSISASLLKLNPHKINEDITVPRSRVPDIIRKIVAIAEKYNLINVNFGHAGDGNIHTNFMIDRNNRDELARAEQAVSEIFQATVAFGGTISGEHGIGIAKAPYLSLEIGDKGIEVIKRIKKAFDPNYILNPNKIIVEPDHGCAGKTG
ncbi:MAG: FAD-binding protein, partial [Proteobacteria bacterium]|nr:FAD-binding protein [Pseudomonadota bacterium]